MGGKLFTPDERAVCEKIADFNGEPINKRAAVLLLLDDGKTQSQACDESGMSLGQLRYALTLFKKNGMTMFPQEEKLEETAPVVEKADKEEKTESKKKKADKKDKPQAKSCKPKSCKCKKKVKKKKKKASQPKKKKKKE